MIKSKENILDLANWLYKIITDKDTEWLSDNKDCIFIHLNYQSDIGKVFYYQNTDYCHGNTGIWLLAILFNVDDFDYCVKLSEFLLNKLENKFSELSDNADSLLYQE